MSESIQHIDVDSDEFIDAPKALRDHVKKLQAQAKDLATERDTLKGQVTATALTGVLTGFKNPERVKRDLLSDKVDPLDTAAVSKWLEANADDYAKGDGAPAQSQSSAATEDAAAHARLNSGGELRQAADMTKHEAAFAEITPDMTGTQIEAVYRKHGI